MKNFFKKILSLCCLSAVINSETINASLSQKISGTLQVVQGGFMIMGSLVTFAMNNILDDLRLNDSKWEMPHKRLSTSLFTSISLYGVTSIAIGAKTLHDTYEQEKNMKEKDIVTKLIHNLKKVSEEKKKNEHLTN